MKRLIGISVSLLCTMMAQAAERPPVCQQSMLPLKYQKPVEDLSGKLPVADYLDAVMDCSRLLPPGATENDPMKLPVVVMPKSAWLDADARRYSELLARQKHPWLVLPAQTQYMGFDFAERALISAEIAAAFADQGSAPDIVQVARALGEPRRRYPNLHAESLTTAVGAQHRVVTFAGHDGHYRMTLTVQLQDCGTNARCKVVKQRDWRALAFTDELPPFRVVNKLRAEIRRDLLGAGPLASATPTPGSSNYLGVTPAKLFASAPSATTASLLASLTSAHDELSRDRLHVLALRGWVDAPPSANSRFYAAYSALALDRRPYALELIRQQKDPANEALRELLNGNYTEARQKIPQVKVPLQRLMLSFVLQDLANSYGRETPFDAALAQQVFGDAQDRWGALLQRRANDSNIWRQGDADSIKLLLDALAPTKGFGYAEVRMGSAVAGREKPLGLVNFRHLRQALGGLGSNATRWQAYWLLEGLAQADVFSDINLAVMIQVAPESGLATVREYEGVLGGHPAFEFERSNLVAMLGRQGDNDEQRRYNQAYEQSEWASAYWSQGATRASYFSANRGTPTMAFADAYLRDFPPRSYWHNQPIGVASDGARGCLLLKYSMNSLDEYFNCLNALKGADAERLTADLRTRFHGSPGAVDLFPAQAPVSAPVPPKPGQDDTDMHIARMRAGIKSDPQEWGNYSGVGGLLVQRRGEYAEAQRVYLSYPLFKTRETRRTVELASAAYNAGSELYWQGQPDLARPLYQIAADLDTGSEGSMASASRLAQLDGDYETAAEILLARGMRYGSSYAYRDYLSLLHVMGHREEANAAFMQVAEAFVGPHAWLAALTGQRMNGMTFDQFRGWVTTPEIIDARHRGQRFASYYTMIWSTTDRKPDANSVKLMEQVVRTDVRRVGNGEQSVTRAHPMDADGLEAMDRSGFRSGAPAVRLQAGPVTHEYLLFMQALSALHAGQYQVAHDRFLDFSKYYSFETGATKAAMAYFALAAAKTGDKLELEKFIEGLPHWEQDFDVWLSRAFFAASRKDVSKAEHALKRAFYVRPHPEARPVLTEWQYAEACELIGRETGDPRFVRMMVEWARKNQRIQPTQAWSYAVEAQFSKNPVEANRALALALYLDPASPRLAGIDEKRRAAARVWLRANNPFLKKGSAPPARPVT